MNSPRLAMEIDDEEYGPGELLAAWVAAPVRSKVGVGLAVLTHTAPFVLPVLAIVGVVGSQRGVVWPLFVTIALGLAWILGFFLANQLPDSWLELEPTAA
jgi:hypothetical protein